MSNDLNDSSGATIQMCPSEDDIPFAQIPNALIRDTSISPNCIWLIIYLLSNNPGWVIKIPQVINHVKEHIGRTKVYNALDEAMEAGYIKREEYMVGGLKRCRYYVSRTKKFKNSFPRSEPPHPVAADAVDRHCKEYKGKEYKDKEYNDDKGCNDKQKVVVVFSSIKKLNISHEDSLSVCSKYSESEIDKAVDRVLKWQSRESDIKALNHVLRNSDSWSDVLSKDEIANENERLLRTLDHLDGKEFKGATIIVSKRYIEFSCGMKIEVFRIEDPKFKEKVLKFIEKLSSL